MNYKVSDDPEINSCAGNALSAAQLYNILSLRESVFVVEQDCPFHELDGRDLAETTTHLWIDDAAGLASYLRILDDDDCWQIGRVVTRFDARGRGLSSKLIQQALIKIGPDPTILYAQAHLAEYYGRFGFNVSGELYLEDGIAHVPMRLSP